VSSPADLASYVDTIGRGSETTHVAQACRFLSRDQKKIEAKIGGVARDRTLEPASPR
jgi:hypothetical protein